MRATLAAGDGRRRPDARSIRPGSGGHGIDLFVRSVAIQLAELSARADRGELTVDIAERVPMTDLAGIRTRASDGSLAGKVVILPTGI